MVDYSKLSDNAKLIFNVQGSFDKEFQMLSFLCQNWVKLPIKELDLVATFLSVINLSTHIVHPHITFDSKQEVQPQF